MSRFGELKSKSTPQAAKTLTFAEIRRLKKSSENNNANAPLINGGAALPKTSPTIFDAQLGKELKLTKQTNAATAAVTPEKTTMFKALTTNPAPAAQKAATEAAAASEKNSRFKKSFGAEFHSTGAKATPSYKTSTEISARQTAVKNELAALDTEYWTLANEQAQAVDNGIAGASGTTNYEEKYAEIKAQKAKLKAESDNLGGLYYELENKEKQKKIATDTEGSAQYGSAQTVQSDMDIIAQVASAAADSTVTVPNINEQKDYLKSKYGITDEAIKNYAIGGKGFGYTDSGYGNLWQLYEELSSQLEQDKTTLEQGGYNYERMAEYEQTLADKQAAEQKAKEDREYAKKHPVLASVDSILSAPFQGVDVLKNSFSRIGKSDSGDLENYVPMNSYNMAATNYVQNVRNQVSEDIEKKTDWNIAGTNVASFLYQSGMSIADSALLISTVGSASVYFMAANSAAMEQKRVLDNGGTNSQALWSGLAAGAAEAIFERISVGNLLKAKNITGIKSLLKSTAEQAGVEFTEEAFTEVSNILTNAVIMVDSSDFNLAVDKYKAQGMTEAKAQEKALLEMIGRVTLAGVGGAISGGVMGGGVAGLNYAGNTENGGQAQAQDAEAQTPDTEAYFKADTSNPYTNFNKEGNLVLPTGEQLNEYSRRQTQNEYAERVAVALRSYNIKNVVIEDMPKSETGRWENGVVYVSSELDTVQAINVKIAHEISHAAQKSDTAFTKDITATMRELGRDVDSAIQQKKETYTEFFRKNGKSEKWIAETITDAYAADEVTADFIGELMKNDDLVLKLSTKPTLVRRIIDAISRLLSRSKSTTEQAAYTELAQKLRKVAGTATETTTRKSRFSAKAENSAANPDNRYSVEGKYPTTPDALFSDESSYVYDYDFLVNQPDMKVVQLDEEANVLNDELEIDREKIKVLGIINAEKNGERVGDTVVVKNVYSERNLQISRNSIAHGLSGKDRRLTNGRLAAVIGDVAKNAIPINSLANKNNQAAGTYAMAGYAEGSEGTKVVAIITVEHFGDKVSDVELIDVTHAANGRIVKEASPVIDRWHRDYSQHATGSFSTISISNLLQIVKSTHQSILSKDVLNHFGEERNPNGHYANKVRYSVEEESVEPWMETETQAKQAGYPVVEGKQVFPYKTWVKNKERGNYGLVVGLGADGGLIVSFWNKDQGVRAKVELPTEQLEVVTGQYQPSDAELTALFQAEPADSLREAVSEEDYKEYSGMWNKAVDAKAGNVVSIATEELPKKAQSYLVHMENKLSGRIAKLMDVPKQANREFLKPIVQKISQEYLNAGSVSDETINKLFAEAWDEGVIVNDEFYNQYKGLKDELRTTAVTISENDTKDIADYGTWLKKQFGRLKIIKDGGVPVDVRYAELTESNPGLFPESITHPADQLRHMSEVAQSISKTEESHDQYYGREAEFYRNAAAHDFETVIMDYLPELQSVRKYYEQKAKYEAERERTLSFAGIKLSESDINTIKQLWKNEKATKKAVEKAVAKNLMTDFDNAIVDKLLIKELTLETVPDNANKKGVREVFEAKAEYEGLMGQIREFNKNRKAALKHEADEYLADAQKWKDKAAGLLYQRETMERNIYDIVKDKATADEIIKRYFEPIHKNEAQRTKLKIEYRERVKSLGLSRKVEKGNELSEAAAVQIYGEALDNINVLETQLAKKAGEDWRNGHTLTEWKTIIEDVLTNNPNMDINKIKDAVEEYRTIYNELFEKMNDARIRNGYEPVDYRRGYFPHFQNEQGDSILSKFGRALGITMNVTELPTTINGLTHTFKPGIRWQGSALKREGYNTTYDAVEGFDKYIEGVSDVICHTDDIQSLRAFADQVRYRSSDEGIREQVDAVREDKTLSIEEKENKIRDIYEHGKFTLSNFIVNLDEYTNLLANKKAFADRNMERMIGRKSYDLVKALENRVASNMVAVNPGSWLTNFIPLAQGGAQLKTTQLLSGMWETLRAYKEEDGFADSSTFLTNRKGSTPLVRTWQEASSATMSKPMQIIDSFVANTLVRARYIQNRSNEISEEKSMSEADRWTAGVMADRSKGSMPTLFESKNPVTKLFTQFQLEVNNQLSYLFKDIPRDQRDKGLAALAFALLKFFIGAWLYNEIYEYFIGRRPALDPIGILNETIGDVTGYELPNTLDMIAGAVQGKVPDFKTTKEGVDTAGINLAKNVAEDLPFVGGLLGGGRLPISSAIPDVGNLWNAGANIISGEGDNRKSWDTIGKEFLKPGAYILPPFGGGQLKKAYQGIKAVIESGRYSVNADGEDVLQYPVFNDSPLQTGINAVQAGIFGPTALKTGQDWIKSGFKSFSAEQTAVYQELVANGTTGRVAYELLKDIAETEAKYKGTRAETTKISEQRKVLNDSDLPAFGKNIIYYGILASDKEKLVMEALDDLGAKYSEVSKTLGDIQNIGSAQEVHANVTELTKTEQKVNVLLSADMTDEQKHVVYSGMISDSDTAEKRITACQDSGLDFNDFLKVQNAFSQIDNDDSLKVSQKAVRFIEEMNNAGYSAKQIGTFGNAFLFRASMASTTAMANYSKLTSSGVSGANAAKVLTVLEELEPLSGKEQVSDLQKMSEISGMSLSEADKLAAMQTILDESTYGKIKIASEYGVKVNGFVTLKEILPQYDADGNGSYKYAEVETAINSIKGLTTNQRAVLWQLQTGGKNNPYNSSIGAQVKTEVAALKEETSATSTTTTGSRFGGAAATPSQTTTTGANTKKSRFG